MSTSCVRNSLILRIEAAARAVNRGLEDNWSVANDHERLPRSCEFNSRMRVMAAEEIESMRGACRYESVDNAQAVLARLWWLKLSAIDAAAVALIKGTLHTCSVANDHAVVANSCCLNTEIVRID